MKTFVVGGATRSAVAGGGLSWIAAFLASAPAG
jgi:hypothetical protein